MFCTNCGSQFTDDNAFCPNCGAKVEHIAQPVNEPAPVAAPVEAAPVTATPVESQPVVAAPVEPTPVIATPVYEPAPAPAPVAPVVPVQPVYGQAPASVYPIATAPAGDPALAKSILVLGICAVAFAVTVWVSIAGIICGAIGLVKAKKFLDENGQIFGQAKVGKFLSLGGLIGSCAISAYVFIYVILGIVSALSNY